MVHNIYKKVYNADSVALKFKGNCITYEQLDITVSKYSDILKDMGVKEGERVILSCPNSPEFIYSYFSVVKNGGIIVPINLQLTIEETLYIIKDCEANFMIIHPEVFKKMKNTKEGIEELLGVKVIVLDEDFHKTMSEISFEENLQEFMDEDAVSTFFTTLK